MPGQSVADRIALQDVMLKYATGVDERDFDLYCSCFADDVDILDFCPESFHGIAAWLAYVKTALEPYGSTHHLMGPMLATVNGNTAHGRTYVQARHYFKQPEGSSMTVWAAYETDFVRIKGKWKIKKHQLFTKGVQTV